MRFETVWEFKTRNFRVRLECAPEDDLDLSWDDDGSVRENLASGFWSAFIFKVAVYDSTGAEIGADFLVQSIHENASDFIDHRECGRYNRELAARGEVGRCGSYFSDMVARAIHDARKVYSAPRARLRTVAA
jgi:hypothetical protein